MEEATKKTADNKAPENKTSAAKPAVDKTVAAKPAVTNQAAQTTKTAKAKVAAIKVSSAREGFRRGGHVFGREAVTLLVSDLTKEQLVQIKDERLLAVTDIEVDATE